MSDYCIDGIGIGIGIGNIPILGHKVRHATRRTGFGPIVLVLNELQSRQEVVVGLLGVVSVAKQTDAARKHVRVAQHSAYHVRKRECSSGNTDTSSIATIPIPKRTSLFISIPTYEE